MINNKRIIIVGAGGSGKDYLKQKFIDKGYKPSVAHTSREPRQGEEFGVDYFFVIKEKFEDYIKKGDFFEYKVYNGWYYGTSNIEFYNSEIFIMTPAAIEELSLDIRRTSMVIYLDIPKDIRKSRLLNRNDADSVDRRLQTDSEDFNDFKDYDIRITNCDF